MRSIFEKHCLAKKRVTTNTYDNTSTSYSVSSSSQLCFQKIVNLIFYYGQKWNRFKYKNNEVFFIDRKTFVPFQGQFSPDTECSGLSEVLFDLLEGKYIIWISIVLTSKSQFLKSISVSKFPASFP